MSVSVVLVIQHAMRMRRVVICGVPRSTLFFPHYLKNGMICEKRYRIYKVCFDFLYNICLKYFILRRTERDMIKNEYWSARKLPVIPASFQLNLDFLDKVWENAQI